MIPWSTKGTSLLGYVGRKSVKISVASLGRSLLQCDPIGAKKGESKTSIGAFSQRCSSERCLLRRKHPFWALENSFSDQPIKVTLGFWAAAQGKGYVDYVSTLLVLAVVLGSFAKQNFPTKVCEPPLPQQITVYLHFAEMDFFMFAILRRLSRFDVSMMWSSRFFPKDAVVQGTNGNGWKMLNHDINASSYSTLCSESSALEVCFDKMLHVISASRKHPERLQVSQHVRLEDRLKTIFPDRRWGF